MGSYFHVIERKVGGNLDAFRRELGRLRESGHFHRDRHERIMRIAQTVGFGHIVRQCLVDTGHRAGFLAAVKEGSVHLSAVPVSGDEGAPGIVMFEKVVRE